MDSPTRTPCRQCRERDPLTFDFTMAFQPIVNVDTRSIFGYEALARGPAGEPAGTVLDKVDETNLYTFDQICRVKAITLAAELSLSGVLCINFLCNAIYQPEVCIRTTLDTAKKTGFPTERILFEFTESEQMKDLAHTKRIIDYYRECGFQIAIDDFGAGYSGLNLLADFPPHIVKIDMGVIRNLHIDTRRFAIVKHCTALCHDLGIVPLAEGIETKEEMQTAKKLGINLMQGFYFAKAGFEALPEVNFEQTVV